MGKITQASSTQTKQSGKMSKTGTERKTRKTILQMYTTQKIHYIEYEVRGHVPFYSKLKEYENDILLSASAFLWATRLMRRLFRFSRFVAVW